MKGTRVAVAMSGGVDSSVACLLLQRKGYDVVGLTMKLLPDSSSDDLPRAPCCTLEMAEDARRICSSLGIPHYTLNLVSEFEEGVIVPFIRDYAAGRTPNPCLQCNRVMKLGHVLRKAREIGASCVATGHYARAGRWEAPGRWIDNCDTARGEGEHERVKSSAGGFAEMGVPRALLLRGVDRTKDQSYALYGLTQDELAHAMFPLGGLTKIEVRVIAREAGLGTAEKPESQDICFVNGSYRQFLAGRGIKPEPGPLVDTSGKVLGRHLGIPFYTVGQRRGLGIAGGRPLYVADLDIPNNTVVVGRWDEAFSTGCIVDNLNLLAAESLDEPVKGTCMVRYRGKESPATMRGAEDAPGTALPGAVSPGTDSPRAARARIDFDTPQFAVTPGQAAVLYQGDLVYAGGTIVRRLARTGAPPRYPALA